MFATHVTGFARLAGLLLLGCLAFFAAPRDAQAACSPTTGWCGNAAEAWDKSDAKRQSYYDECAATPPTAGRCRYQSICDLPKSDKRPLKLILSQYQGQNAAMVMCPQWPAGGPLNMGVSYYPKDNRLTGGCPDGNCNMEGDGLDTGTGNMEQTPSDYSDPRSGDRMGLKRSYSSDPTYSGRSSGRRWAHNFDRTIAGSSSASSVYAERPNGRRIRFSKSGSNWLAASITREKLTELVDAAGARTGWKLQVGRDGSTETYGSTGRLLRIDYRDAYALTFAYSNSTTPAAVAPFSGLLLTVTDTFGRVMSLDYDSNGFLETMTAPDGLVAQYAVSPAGLLTGVTYSDGSYVAYVYTREQLTAIYENGILTKTFAYDPALRVAGAGGGAGGGGHAVSYGTSSSTTTTPSGATITRNLSVIKGDVVATSVSVSCFGCTTRTTTRTYDTNGFVNLVTRPGNVVTDYDYDANGHLLQQVRAKGTPIQQQLTAQWSSSLRMPTQVTLQGQRYALTYNARGQVETAKVIDTTSQAERLTTYAYCEDAAACGRVGALLSIDGPRTDVSDVTLLEYRLADGAGYRQGDLWRVTNALGHVTEFAGFDAAGRVTRVIDANGVVTDLEYTPRGRLSRSLVRGADDGIEADDAVTSINYDALGMVRQITEPDGTYLLFTFDAERRLTDVVDSVGNRIHYTRDVSGNSVLDEVSDGSGQVTTSVARAFDKFNQLRDVLAERTFGGDEILTQLSYDTRGNLDQAVDPLGRTSDTDVDQLNRVVQSIGNAGGTGAERPVTGFGYDARDNLTQVIDPKGLATTYAYNGFDELTQLTSPDTGTTTLEYDAAGNPISQTDARSVQTTFAYDALGRLTSAHPGGDAPVQYAYDTVPVDCTVGETFATGRLASITDESGSTSYCYDRFGHVVRKTQAVTEGSVLTIGASYDNAGRLLAMTYPSGSIVVYSYDDAGRMRRVDATPTPGGNQVTLVADVAYAPFGPMTSLVFGNGRTLSRDYDRNYDIESIDSGTANDGFEATYSLDAGGNVVRVAEAGSTPRTFEYDGVDRLEAQREGGSLVESFTYDATGNRLSKTTTGTQTYTYPADSHHLTAVDSEARVYDANGNTTHIGSALEFVYNARNRLATVKEGGVATRTYVYNGRGERVAKWFADASEVDLQFVYDEAGHLIGEYDSAGNRVAEYVWMGDLLVGVLKPHDGSTYQYVETDHLGTPRAVVNPVTQAVVWRWRLAGTAFGEHSVLDDADGNGIAYTFNLRFPGQYFDGVAGINYNYFRDYDARTGRYLQSDPIGLAGGLSTYSYVGSNPMDAIDPLGLRDSTSPWQTGWEWLTGTGPRHRSFSDGDEFAELLRSHGNLQRLYKRACLGDIPNKGKWDYSVGGWKGVPLYLHDYSNLATGGNTGNLAVTYLGSYNTRYSIQGDTLRVTVTNSSTIQSATHPPVLGYTAWWRNNIGDPLDKKFATGPMSKTTQEFILSFDLSECGCQ